jgi:hypothetical protein
MGIASLGLEEMLREEELQSLLQSLQGETFGTYSSILLVEEKAISYMSFPPGEATALVRFSLSVARDLTDGPLREWVKHARADRTKGRKGPTTAQREELARLRKENVSVIPFPSPVP